MQAEQERELPPPELVYYPDPALTTVCAPVNPEYMQTNPEFFELLFDDMWNILKRFQGIGLAAPQIGSMIRAIIVHTEAGCKIELINPEIELMQRFGKFHSDEGCLSWPGKRVHVFRYRQVKVKGLDRHGEPVTFGGKMQQAAALQHEIDHLDGINIADKALTAKE